MTRLAIVSTHPIQYNSPIFELLAAKIDIKVFYTYSQRENDFFDKDFGVDIQWDIPLLKGYKYTFVQNTASKPGLDHFRGIKCPALIRSIEEWGATQLLVFGWNYQAHFRAMRYFKGKIPVLFRGDSTLLDFEVKSIYTLLSGIKNKAGKQSFIANFKSFAKYKLRKNILTYIYKHIDKALYVGQNNKAYYLKHGVKEHQLKFVPHAIDNQRFFDNDERKYEEKAAVWRTKLGLHSDDVVLLFAGKFESKKAPQFLLHAFNKVKNEIPHLRLVLLGSGPQEDVLKKMGEDNKQIFFLPFQNQSQMPVVYRLSNIFCLPSKGPGETWGLAVNEAMACGRPVLVSDKVGCAVDLVNSPSMTFKSGDMDDFTAKLKTMVSQYDNKHSETLIKQISDWNFNHICKAILQSVEEE